MRKEKSKAVKLPKGILREEKKDQNRWLDENKKNMRNVICDGSYKVEV